MILNTTSTVDSEMIMIGEISQFLLELLIILKLKDFRLKDNKQKVLLCEMSIIQLFYFFESRRVSKIALSF